MTIDTPSFHDGNLTGVQLLDAEVRLTLRRWNGELWEARLTGVQALHIEDFREGNIISCFDVIQGARPEKEILERLFPGPHPSAAQHYLDTHVAFLADKADMVRTAAAKLVSMTSSYGADLAALATEVIVTRKD